MVLRPDQERVRTLLQDTITLLCRNGLSYKNEFNIKALIGITLDQDEVFLVDIKETIKNAPDKENDSEDDNIEDNGSVLDSPTRKRRKRQRSRKRSHGGGGASDLESAASDSIPGTPSNNRVKAEDEESNDAIIIKDEPDYDTNYGNNQDINLSQAQLFPASQDSLQWDPQALSAAQFQSIASSQQQQQMNTSLSSLSTASASISSPLQQQQQTKTASSNTTTTTSPSSPAVSGRTATPSTTGPPYECTPCNKRFSSAYSLRRHDECAHRGIYRHRCPHCDKGFTDRSHLRGHMASQHTHRAEYVCAACGKGFSYSWHLKTHQGGRCPALRRLKEQEVALLGQPGTSGQATAVLTEPLMNMLYNAESFTAPRPPALPSPQTLPGHLPAVVRSRTVSPGAATVETVARLPPPVTHGQHPVFPTQLPVASDSTSNQGTHC